MADSQRRSPGGKEYRLSRLRRLDFQGAIHIVRVQGRKGMCIFFDAIVLARGNAERWHDSPHLQMFLQLVDACSYECGAQLFGYCVEPNDCSLIYRTLGAPLEEIMRLLNGRYSRYLHSTQVLSRNARAFAARYDSKVLAPEYLPHAVRRVHANALRAGLCRRAVDYPFSSASAYLGERGRARVETQEAWRALELKGLVGLRRYREFMEQPESSYVAELFEKGSPLDSRVVGGKLFVSQARDAAGHPPKSVSRDQLVGGVAQIMGLDATELFTSPTAVLGRSLVAWYARRLGVASLSQVATWFSVSGAELGRGIRHYRRLSPDLFERTGLPGIDGSADG
jgi:hypothetical protein